MIKVDYVKTKFKKRFLQGYGYGQTSSLYSAYMTKISMIQSRPDYESKLATQLNQGNDTVTAEMVSKYGGRWSENSEAIEEFYSKMIAIIDGLLGTSTVTPAVTPTVVPTVAAEVTPITAVAPVVAPATTIAITMPTTIKEYLPYIFGGLLIVLLIRRR